MCNFLSIQVNVVLCSISINKDILKELDNNNLLHDLVLQKFISKPRKLDFQFKYLALLIAHP